MEEKGPVEQGPERTQGTERAQGGRRLAGKKGLGKGAKVAIAVAAVLVVALLGSYVGLCAYAAGDRVLPGTYVGDVDLSGLSLEEAAARMEEASQARYEALEIPIRVGEDNVITFSAKDGQVKAIGDSEAAVQAGKGSFLAGGWNFLAGLLGRETQLNCQVSVGNSAYLADTLRAVSAAVDQPVEDPHWEVDEEAGELVFYRGRTGQSVDQEQVFDDLMTALADQGGDVTAAIRLTAPQEPDFDAIKTQVDREPQNASLDVETDQVIPHKLGLTMDAQKAREAFSGLTEGESGRLALETQEPEITTLELRAGLFRDLLGEGSSKISGDANRVGNVKLAAEACNGVVLLPGERMSYNQTTGQRTAAKGYRKASGYTANGIEDMVGGGVCQPSSTLYLACLNADLEIVERSNHRYTVSYMPDGMDATVSWPNLDYVFANSTPYPIKVETSIENKTLTVRIYGTKTDNSYVKMESVRLSTTPAGVRYQADESVPAGTTRVLQAAHTGKKVQVYKNIYNGDGTLRSRTLISTDTYRPGDKVVAYNPADGAPDGSVAPTGSTAPTVDPMTGLLVDPTTGEPIQDPATGEPVVADPGPAEPSDPGPAAAPSPQPGETEPAPEPGQADQPAPEPGQSDQPAPETPAGGTTEPAPEPPAPSEPPVLPPEPTPVPAPEGIPMS